MLGWICILFGLRWVNNSVLFVSGVLTYGRTLLRVFGSINVALGVCFF